MNFVVAGKVFVTVLLIMLAMILIALMPFKMRQVFFYCSAITINT